MTRSLRPAASATAKLIGQIRIGRRRLVSFANRIELKCLRRLHAPKPRARNARHNGAIVGALLDAIGNGQSWCNAIDVRVIGKSVNDVADQAGRHKGPCRGVVNQHHGRRLMGKCAQAEAYALLACPATGGGSKRNLAVKSAMRGAWSGETTTWIGASGKAVRIAAKVRLRTVCPPSNLYCLGKPCPARLPVPAATTRTAMGAEAGIASDRTSIWGHARPLLFILRLLFDRAPDLSNSLIGLPHPWSTGSGVPVCLAPMSGLTDRPFRSMARKFGASMVVSEMIASDRLVAGEEEETLKMQMTHLGCRLSFSSPLAIRSGSAKRRGWPRQTALRQWTSIWGARQSAWWGAGRFRADA